MTSKAEKRRAATEREKRRMERVNEQLQKIKEIVCPQVQNVTKSKILQVAIDRLIYLERLTSAKNTPPAQINSYSDNIQPISKKCDEENYPFQYHSPEANSTNSWDSGYAPIDFTEKYPEQVQLQYDQEHYGNQENSFLQYETYDSSFSSFSSGSSPTYAYATSTALYESSVPVPTDSVHFSP